MTTPPVIPGYEFIRPLGAGATSVVWLARQLSLDRHVAVKILSLPPDAPADEPDRFQAEARAAARLDHPNIVRILDFGAAPDGSLFYTMEYVDGSNLADWLRDNTRMDPATALQLASIAASALRDASSAAGLVHRDLKPANILLASDGSVKLADLGLARLDGPTPPPSPDAIEGTPAYLAPEQIAGLPPTPKSDVYSLGLTLYHLLTGQPPFADRTLSDCLSAQQDDFLPDPVTAVPDLPAPYSLLLAKMTAKNPDDRPDWPAVLDDLTLVSSGRFPNPPYPPDTASTVLLAHGRRPGNADAPRTVLRNGKRAIAVTSTAARNASSRPAPKKSSSGCLRAFLVLLVLAALAAIAAFLAFHGHPERLEAFKKAFSSPSRPTAYDNSRPDIPRSSSPSDDAETEEPAPEPAAPTPPADPGTDVPGAWNHPGYIQAATDFNAALSRYQAALDRNAPPDDPDWPAIAADAAKTAAALDALRPAAPPSVPLRDYANQAWQLAKDATLATRTPDAKKADFFHAHKARHETEAPWPTPSATDEFSPRHIQLGYAWDALPAPDTPAANELLLLLAHANTATPSPATRAQAGMNLFPGFTALMPVAEAAAKLQPAGALLPVRSPLPSPPFPYASLFSYPFPAGRYGNIRRPLPPYPELHLVADNDDQLVGLRFLDPAPTALARDPFEYTGDSSVPDFFDAAFAPEGSDIRHRHTLSTSPSAIRIDSETADFTDPASPRPLRQSTILLSPALAPLLYYHFVGLR